MRKTEARSLRALGKGLLSFALALAMALGCWPTTALKALADEIEVMEGEEQASTSVTEEAIPDAPSQQAVDGSMPTESLEDSEPSSDSEFEGDQREDEDSHATVSATQDDAIETQDGDERQYSFRFENEEHAVAFVNREGNDANPSYSNPTRDVHNTVAYFSDDLDNEEGVTFEYQVVNTDDPSENNVLGDEYYAVSDDTKSITPNVLKLAEDGIRNICVRAQAKQGERHLCWAEEQWELEIRDRELDYQLPDDISMLPGWKKDGYVKKSQTVWVKDEDHPDGEEELCTVVAAQSSNESVAKAMPNGEDWDLEAVANGEATITLTYHDYWWQEGDGSDTHTFNVYVSDDVYEIELDPDFNPGATVGSEQKVSVELMHYSTNNLGGEEVQNARLYWELDTYKDGDANEERDRVKVKAPDGTVVENARDKNDPKSYETGEYHIERLFAWGAGIHVRAVWSAEGSEEQDLWAHFGFNAQDIWFEDAYDRLFVKSQDSVRELTLNAKNVSGMEGVTISYVAGIWNGDQQDWGQQLAEGTDYAIENNKVTVYGAQVLNSLDTDDVWIEVHAEAKKGDTLVSDARFGLQVRRSIDRDIKEDREMLLGDEDDVPRHAQVQLFDEDHEDGEDFEYEVFDVTSGNENVVMVEKRYEDDDPTSEDFWWSYRAIAAGESYITVRYRDPFGHYGDDEYDEYTFKVTSKGELYELNVWADEQVDTLLPGATLGLHANGRHRVSDGKNEDGDYLEHDENDHLRYEWSLAEGSAYATLTPSGDSCVLRISDTAVEGFVRVKVALYDDADGAAAQPCCDDDSMCYDVRSDYTTLYVSRVNPDLIMGGTQDITAEVRHYKSGLAGGLPYTTVDDADIWWGYDTNCVSIKDKDGKEVAQLDEHGDWEEEQQPTQGGTFTIRRTGDWDSDIEIDADWENDGHSRRDYQLNGHDYDAWYVDDDEGYEAFVTRKSDDSFENGTSVTATLDVSNQLKELKNQWSIAWTVGTGEWKDGSFVWKDKLQGSDYSVVENADGRYTLTIDENKIETLANEKKDDLRVEARVMVGEGEGAVTLCETETWITIRERLYDLELGQVVDMLPGWNHTIKKHEDMLVWDEHTSHGGDYFEYEITDVTIAESHPEADGDEAAVISITELNDDKGWDVRAVGYGSAVVRLTYNDEYHKAGDTYTPQTYDLNFVVSGDVYELTSWVEGRNRVTMGDTVELYAQGRHKLDGGTTILDGMNYEWSIPTWFESWATLTVDEQDSRHATLKIHDFADEDDPHEWEQRDIRPLVIMYDGKDDQGKPKEVARSMQAWISVSTDYYAVEVAETFDANADLLDEQTLTPTLNHYYYDQNNKLQSVQVDVSQLSGFAWKCEADNEEALQITQNNNPASFTVKRLRDWSTSFDIVASWAEEPGNDDDGKRREEARFQLAEKSYEMQFDSGEDGVYVANPDCAVVAHLDVSRMASFMTKHKECEPQITVREVKSWPNENHMGPEWGETIIEGAGFTVDRSNSNMWTITIPVSSFERFTVGSMVWAQCKDADGGFEYNAVAGLSHSEQVPHPLQHVEAKAPTADAIGNTEYWSCDNCGMLFSDASGTNAITEEDTRVLIDIGQTDIAIPSQTYTGKALQPNVTIKYAGKVVARSAYQVTLAKSAVNAGNYDVTIAGDGKLIEGTTTKTFSIAPAAATVAAKDVTKSYGAADPTLSATVTGLVGSDKASAITYKLTRAAGNDVGTYAITPSGNARQGNYSVTFKAGKLTITKANSTMTIKAKKKTVQLVKVANKAQKVKGAIVVSKANGKVTYALDKSTKKAKKTKKFKINSKGVITVPKKTAKGTYKLKVNVTCAGDGNHKGTTKQVTVKVVVR